MTVSTAKEQNHVKIVHEDLNYKKFENKFQNHKKNI
jgi:hypothetical protein